jgi:hypothetical protein
VTARAARIAVSASGPREIAREAAAGSGSSDDDDAAMASRSSRIIVTTSGPREIAREEATAAAAADSGVAAEPLPSGSVVDPAFLKMYSSARRLRVGLKAKPSVAQRAAVVLGLLRAPRSYRRKKAPAAASTAAAASPGSSDAAATAPAAIVHGEKKKMVSVGLEPNTLVCSFCLPAQHDVIHTYFPSKT